MPGPLLAGVHPTIPDVVTFAVSAAIILVGALGVVTARNPVHAALSLVMTLFGVAVLFVEQRADFLAAVQVIVYAGAIVILFLFVIMFLGVDRRENIEAEPLKGQRPLALVLIAIALLGGLLLAFASQLHHRPPRRGLPTRGLRGLERGPAGAIGLHDLPVRLRGDRRPAGGGGGGCGGARPPAGPSRRGRRRPGGPRPNGGDRTSPGRGRPGDPRGRRRAGGRRGRGRNRGGVVSLGGGWYLALAAVLFAIGAVGLLVRRNVLVMFMCIELMLNAANLTFVTFSRMLGDIAGQVVVFFVLVVAAAEVVVGLGIVVAIFRRRDNTTADDLHVLKG